MATDLLFLGTNGQVAAIDKATGQILWQTKLKSGLSSPRFVTLLVDGSRLYAHTGGEVFCLEANSGRILWKNALAGLGYEIANLALPGVTTSVTTAAAEQRQQASRNAATST